MSSISAGTTSGTALVSTGDTTGTLDLKTGAGATTALSIDASQRVGIGTSSPAQRLDVRTTSGNAYVGVGRASQSTGQVGLTLYGGTSGTDWIIYQPTSSNNLTFYGNGSDQVVITSGGKVGIGVTNPSALLDVRGSAPYMYVSDTVGANKAAFVAEATNTVVNVGSTYLGAAAVPLALVVGGAEKARIDSSGNLGLGVTPSATTGSGVKGFEIGGIGNGLLGNSANVWATQNVYFNAGFKKAGAGYATMYNQSGGTHNWNVSTTSGGAAGDAITFTQAMTLDASSNLNLRGNFTAGSAVTTTGAVFGVDSGGSIAVGASSGDAVIRGAVGSGTTNRIVFAQGNTGNIYGLFDGSGNVGIGTSSPNDKLTVASDNYLSFQTSSTTFNSGRVARIGGVSVGSGNGYLVFETYQGGSGGGERMRIDSSGNLLIGGTTSYGKLTTYVGNNSRFAATTSSGAGGGAGGWQLPAYYGSVKVNYIDCELTDGTGGSEASVMRFATIGSGTLAERMRIDSSGAVLAGTTSASISSSGLKYEGANGALLMVRDGNTPFAINRLTNDGNLIEFYQATSLEGTISVSGTTVSYNGGHLSRWSQTTDNTRIPLVKGTVMSNLDQMANWDGQANEQLNCMKVSDVEGDVNVAGVFVNWDNDDAEFTNDMNIAMTGDMIIRIAQGTVVQRGDLLMSAGDGTAKPQGDDIVRSKTVAKVTSTHITCTYDDGSYCVPCVLMAC